MKPLHILEDKRVNCLSLVCTIQIDEYLSLISPAYENQGALAGQRDKLKTTSAVRIRNRMESDFENGAVLPTVTIGSIITEEQYKQIIELCKDAQTIPGEVIAIIESKPKEDLSIIDGMQRTSVYFELRKKVSDRQIRIEFWLATQTTNLTYRMLVLNTGQVPWTLRRQIEVIYSPFIKEFSARLLKLNGGLKVEVIKIDDGKARIKSGQYHANNIIEMYLVFALRKAKIDLQGEIATDFERLDVIEAVARETFLDFFVRIFACFMKIDLKFGEYTPTILGNRKVNRGKEIFDSNTARAGFIAAASQKIYGRVGQEKTSEQQEEAILKIEEKSVSLIQKIEASGDLSAFYALDILNAQIENLSKNKIGDLEREFYLNAFKTLLADDFEINSLESCWRA